MSEPDVIIVGAGAAGIGAGLECAARGLACVILEGADRVGGRAHTAAVGLERDWDLGCHWMHCASKNALVAYADRFGATYSKNPGWENSMLWSDGKEASADDVAASEAAIAAAFDAVYAAGATGRDVPITDVLPALGPWDRCARHVLQLEIGDDPEVASTDGYSNYNDTGEDWPVLSGYGTLIARMAEGLDIRLGARVHGLGEAEGGVRVETSMGEMQAKAAIVTVSTNVLSSGAIRFAPGPAADFAAQAVYLPCGAFEKVAFTLTRLPPVLGDRRHLMVNPPDEAPALDFKVLDGAPPMIIATIAGHPARALMDMPEAERIVFVQSRLCLALGADVADLITGAACINWLHDPLILGSYSHAAPGYGQLRRNMIAADTGPIGFAGEAFSQNHQATAHGAYQSGRDVAARLATQLEL